MNRILLVARDALSRALRTWPGKIGLGVIFIATLAIVAFMNPAGDTDTRPARRAVTASYSAPPDVQLLKTNDLTSEPNLERVVATVVLPEGGLLALSNRRGGSSFVYKFEDTGATIWRRELPDAAANAVGVSTDGNYWVGGFLRDKDNRATNPHLTAFTQRITPDGELSERVALSTPTGFRFFHCAVKQDEKFIQLDTVDMLDEYFQMQVPALSMIDSSGALLWQKLIPFDQGLRIEEIPQQLLNCAGIFVAGSEHIIAAQPILILPDLKAPEEIRKELATGIHMRPGTLVVAFDLAGNEVARIRHTNVIGALLTKVPAGVMLFETSYKKPGLMDFPGLVDQQARIYTYDANLKELKPPMIVDDSNLDVVNAVYPTPDGGTLLAGCSGTLATIFVRYISSDGVASPKRAFTELGFCGGGDYQFAAGEHPDEALLLVQTPNQGNRLLTLKYSNLMPKE
jgi:hypothetical protein